MELKVRLGVQFTQLPVGVGKVAVGMTIDGGESKIGCSIYSIARW